MLHRWLVRFESVSDRQLFAFTVLWVIVGGLVLQLVVLPFAIPAAHGGNGLIASQDSLGFHAIAVRQSQKIHEQGWGAWEMWPSTAERDDKQFTAGIASALYAVTFPEPWVMLPLNGLCFGIAVTALRGLLTTLLKSPGVALAGVTPFFLFPSFVPIWGQLQKDVITGAGLSMVLYALVLACRSGSTGRLVRLAIGAAVGIGLLWIVRPYAVLLVTAATVAFALLAMLAKSCERTRLTAVALVIAAACAATVQPWAVRRNAPVSGPTGGTEVLFAGEIASCAPAPTTALLDRLLYTLCAFRFGYVTIGEMLKATSGYDYEVRLRTIGDVVRYAPRAVQVAVLEPGPRRWGTESSPIGRLATLFVPFEMIVAYGALFLALVVGFRWVRRPEILAVLAFCVVYSTLIAYSTSQIGTLYRMRAFAFAIMVGTAFAVALSAIDAGGSREREFL